MKYTIKTVEEVIGRELAVELGAKKEYDLTIHDHERALAAVSEYEERHRLQFVQLFVNYTIIFRMSA